MVDRFGRGDSGRTPVASQAELVRPPVVLNGQTDYNTGGTLDPVRASWVGIPDGAPFSIGPIFLLGTIHFNTTIATFWHSDLLPADKF